MHSPFGMAIQSRQLQTLGIVALASVFVLACGRRQATPATPLDYRGGTVESGQLETGAEQSTVARGNPPMGVESELSLSEADVPQWRITAVVIDVGVAELCGIDAARANFDYDSDELDADAKATIAELARCFADGPLAGREVAVVGHADPRGPDDYNRELGMSRAEAVAQALTREGVARTRIDVESHGEAEAHSDPAEWPDDRRVDIGIAG